MPERISLRPFKGPLAGRKTAKIHRVENHANLLLRYAGLDNKPLQAVIVHSDVVTDGG